MFLKYTDRLIKTVLLPFTELEFYKDDFFKKLVMTSEYKDIVNDLYPLINKNYKIDNLDETKMILKSYHPLEKLRRLEYHNNIYNYYIDFLADMSQSFLSHRDGKIVFKYWKSSNENNFKVYEELNKVLLWHSMNKMFTIDILIVMYLISNDMKDIRYLENNYSKVALEDLQLEDILNKGLAETHLHFSAASDFYNFWTNIMNTSLGDLKIIDKKTGFNIIDKELMRQPYLNKLILIFSNIRLVLAKFIEIHFDESFNYYANQNEELESNDLLILRFIQKYLKDSESILKLELNDLNDINGVIKSIIKIPDGKKESDVNDILDYLFDNCTESNNKINTYSENILLMKCIKYLKENNSNNEQYFGKLFFDYIRFKNEIYQLMVQGNQLKGLDNFEHYFVRSTSFGSPNEDYYTEMLKSAFTDNNLRKFEMRISPKLPCPICSINENEKTIKSNLKNILSAYKKIIESKIDNSGYNRGIHEIDNSRACNLMKVPQLGIIIHFLKTEEVKTKEKCWAKYEYNKESYEYLAYKEHIESYLNQGEAIKRLRNKIPYLDKYLVGIDAASIENNVEPWVFAKIYDDIRDSKDSYMQIDRKFIKPIQSLGFTFHAGEEFRHILTGIRRIDEVIEHFKFHAGDRIGHGIALGLDVKWWENRHRMIVLPRLEHLENLLWIWGSCKDQLTNIDIGYIERHILEHAKNIYGNGENLNVYDLWKAYQEKFKKFNPKSEFINEVNNPDNMKSKFKIDGSESEKYVCDMCFDLMGTSWSIEKLLHAYNCKKYLIKMLEPIQIEVKDSNIEIIKYMQNLVRQKASKKGIVIETNPSSNVTLSEVENIFNHYIMDLNKLDELNHKNSVQVSINTDDPSVFNTSLSNEFAYIYYSLLEKGYCKESVLNWIDKVRKTGMNSSFIKEKQVIAEVVLEELDCILKELEK